MDFYIGDLYKQTHVARYYFYSEIIDENLLMLKHYYDKVCSRNIVSMEQYINEFEFYTDIFRELSKK